ncbi:MAG: rhomboid family intramembrane serine protease [Crocinitomicaceae bacterium]|nr:rhomboid family intramembrane serine protease [Crocinitomicaceae bacterium]|tara:strand:- start:5321 stop:5932 length:612 start_codon:yes stop_codon:yes gene_type:complete
MSITLLIIVATALVSISGFSNRTLFHKLDFSPYQVMQRKEWYRLVSHVLLHGDWMHLFVNMFVLFSFGNIVERSFPMLFDGRGTFYYLLLYVGGAAFASIPALKRYGNNPNYTAIGASGAVAAVLFTSIILLPTSKIYVMFIPIGIPAYLFGPLYIGLEYYLDKRGGGRIAHDAHYWGALFGLVFPIALKPALFLEFIGQIFG